jgi:hypothetical protein
VQEQERALGQAPVLGQELAQVLVRAPVQVTTQLW